MNNLIAATTDNNLSIGWGASILFTGADSDTNGATNTVNIVTQSGATSPSTYASGLCSIYTNDGYSDWFLPAKDQLNCLYDNRSAIGGLNAEWYWSSTQAGSSNAWAIRFSDGFLFASAKGDQNAVRCVRNFSP